MIPNLSKGRGILLHITSLPGTGPLGQLGAAAAEFIRYLQQNSYQYWQILPLNPLSAVMGYSPYSSDSVFAGNPLLICPETLKQQGLLSAKDLHAHLNLTTDRCDYAAAEQTQATLLTKAWHNFNRQKPPTDWLAFCENNAYWLADYALFKALKKEYGGSWLSWPVALRTRTPAALQAAKKQFQTEICYQQFEQYLFQKQWQALHKLAQNAGLKIIGDLPIYPSLDSADVWANQALFQLTPDGHPLFVAGVPPDYFSTEGQLWGNPVYDWPALAKTDFTWWQQRLRRNAELFDLIRLDHFRGLVAYWRIPSQAASAKEGAWIPAPATALLSRLREQFPALPLIAEDLGILTPEVTQVMQDFQLPGMKILLFAFTEDNPNHPYLPENYPENCLVYTGTHDNNTLRGWWENEASPAEKNRLSIYLGKEINLDTLHLDLIKLAETSRACVSIIPMQDLLGLPASARMNTPGTVKHNWEWRLTKIPQ